MTKIITLPQIKNSIETTPDELLIQQIEDGFVQYSKGNVVVPPVGYLPFENPTGDVHIKYGYIRDDDFYVIKIASGFYENPKIGLNSSNGLMLVFNKNTGALLSVLLDEGYLTDVRTALAGAVVAKHLAPENVNTIGIVGTGIQARLQLKYLRSVVRCRKVMVWGRSFSKAEEYARDTSLIDFDITPVSSINELTQVCNLIITTTPSHSAIIFNKDMIPGTLITAVGADAPGKQELEPSLFGKATEIIADSTSQCIDHGELCTAVKERIISKDQIIELGNYIANGRKRNPDSILAIADLTGVAVQDIQIAKYVHLRSESDL